MFIFYFFGILFFFLGIKIIYYSINFLDEIIIIDLSVIKKKLIEIIFFIDWLSLRFLGFLIIISRSVYLFGNNYMEKDILIKRFFFYYLVL